MTSNDLFFKLLWREIKSRLWVAVILLLIFMIRFPVRGLTAIEMNLIYLEDNGITLKQLELEMVNWVSSSSYTLMFLILLGAALCAFTGFAYLHSAKKLDVFHSIPLKRGKMMAIQYVSGLVLFLVPFLLSHLSYIAVCMIKGVFTGDAGLAILGNIAVQCCFFLLVYHVAVIAIMLTGRLLVGVGVFIVIITYPYLIYQVLMGYVLDYFSTFYDNIDSTVFIRQLTYYKMGNFKPWLIIVLAVLTAVLMPWLYKRRVSEAAGHSIAFGQIKPWVKILLMIPTALSCGMFAQRMTTINRDFWLIVGIIFGLVAAQCLIEIIYSYDVKSVISHRISFAAACILTALLAAVFRFDLLGYDRYMPNQNHIADMGLYVDRLGMKSYQGEACSPIAGLEEIHMEERSEAYQIIAAGIERSAVLKKMSEAELEEELEYGEYVYVRYKLKSGRVVMRQYVIPLSEIMPELQVLYDEGGFKEAIFPILKREDKESIEIALKNNTSEKPLKLSDEERQNIMTAYQQDAANLTFKEITSVSPIGELTFIISDEWDSQAYPIYDSFANTLNELEAAGYPVAVGIDADQVQEIELYDGDGEFWQLDIDVYTEDNVATITDRKMIEQIVPLLVWNPSPGIATEKDMHAVVYMKGGENYGNFYSLRRGGL